MNKRHGGSVVGASDLGAKGREFEPRPVRLVVFLCKRHSHSASLYPGV